MNKQGASSSTDERLQQNSQAGESDCGCARGEPCNCKKDEGTSSTCESGCCCGMSGTGGKIRVALLIVVAIVVVVLMVRGFATAG